MLVANKVTDAGVVIDHIYNWFGVFGGLVVALTLSFSAGEQHLMRLIRHLTRGDLYPGWMDRSTSPYEFCRVFVFRIS